MISTSFYIYIFILLIIFLCILVLISKTPIGSIISLIEIYLLSSLLFLILGAEFISILLIIVYVGAISILFVFIIMMLNIRVAEVHKSLVDYSFIGIIICSFFFLLIIFILKNNFVFFPIYTIEHNDWLNQFYGDQVSNINLIAEILYQYFFSFYVILAGFILLLAMIGSIVIVLDFKNIKKFSLDKNKIYLWKKWY